MSIISKPTNAPASNVRNIREPSEFDGLWLNPGVNIQGEDGTAKFVRLSRGIAVSDLKIKKLYDSMSPEFAAQIKLENEMTQQIWNHCRKLEEGEAVDVPQLSIQLYRRNEEVDASTIEDATTEKFDLFATSA